jgi:hypothetical protein
MCMRLKEAEPTTVGGGPRTTCRSPSGSSRCSPPPRGTKTQRLTRVASLPCIMLWATQRRKKSRIVCGRGFRVGDRSRGRYATPADSPRHDCTPYRGLRARRWGLGFVHRSRTIFCRAVPNLRVTIGNGLSLRLMLAVQKRIELQWVESAQGFERRDGGGGDGGARVRRVPHRHGGTPQVRETLAAARFPDRFQFQSLLTLFRHPQPPPPEGSVSPTGLIPKGNLGF